MNELAAGGGAFSALVVTIITVGLGGMVGWWLRKLIAPKGKPDSAHEVGRVWAGWVAFGVCLSLLTRFFGRLDLDSFAVLVAVGGIWIAFGYALGWAYGRFFKFKNAAKLDDHVATASQALGKNSNPVTPMANTYQPVPVEQPKEEEQPEETLWADALSEFGGENRKPGLWAKAFATADGDETKAKARYLQSRVAELQAEQQMQQHDKAAAKLRDQLLRETKENLEAKGNLVTDTTLEMILQLKTKVLASSDSGGAYQLAKQLASSFGYVVLRPSMLSNPLHHEIYKEGDWKTCLAKQSSPEEFVKWTIKTLC